MNLSWQIMNVNKELQDLINQAVDESGEIVDESLLIKHEDLQEHKNNLFLAMAANVLELEGQAEWLDKSIRRIKERKDTLERRAETFKRFISSNLREKLSNDTVEISFRKSSSVKILDDKIIPSEYIKSKVVFDLLKSKMAEDLKAGKTIEGVELLEKSNIQIK